MPAQPKSSDKPARREGPTPAHQLLTAVRAAVAAEVPAAQITSALDFACAAAGAAQAGAWRTVATMLDTYTAAAKPAAETQQPSA
jgi:hypothetical protein